MTTTNLAALRAKADADGGGYEVVPAGDYTARVEKATATTTKTGKPMVKATFVIEGGPSEGKRVFTQFVVSEDSPKALAIFFRHMDVLGAGPVIDAGGSIEQVAGAIIGARASIKVAVGSYNGNPTNEVKDVKAAGGAAPAVAGIPIIPTPASGEAPF